MKLVTYLSGGGKVGDKITAIAVCDKSKLASSEVIRATQTGLTLKQLGRLWHIPL